jgi:hypothetical protein
LHWKNKYGDNVVIVVSDIKNYDKINDALKTKAYMKMGIPILYQAAVYNETNKTYGIVDLLVRSDWVNKLFEVPTLTSEETMYKAPLLNGNYHYIVVDIKWSDIHFCADGKTMRNEGFFPANKEQVTVYNASLGPMQGYIPPKAYILGKSWTHGTVHRHNCFDRLGVIDYEGFDKQYIKKTNDAIQWIRKVRYNGHMWSCLPQPSVPELYPNMNNSYDAPYHFIKKEHADRIKELTDIWRVGYKHRNHALKQGITSWNDPRCTAKNMGIKGEKIGPTIDKIIKIQSGSNLILPKKIKNNIHNWKTRHELDFYIDFEDLSGELYSKIMDIVNSVFDYKILFIAGIGYIENCQWKYKVFLANSINRTEEQRIITEMITFIETRTQEYNVRNNSNERPKLFHWSHAEKSSFIMFNKRYNNAYIEWVNNVTWIDMCKIFQDEPIAIKNAKNFSLKEIANAMHQNNMIQTEWPTGGPGNGRDAMMDAIRYYHFQEDSKHDLSKEEYYKKMMQSIIDYNEVDCKAVYEIVEYLRKNH